MYRRVVFLVVVMMMAALDIGAKPPVLDDLEAAPEPGKGEAAGLKLKATVQGEPGAAAVLCLQVHNPTDQAVEADVEVALMEQPASLPMARMVPMPRERARRVVHVALGPGEKMEERLTIDKVKLPEKKKKAANKAGTLAALAAMSSPRLFAEVRQPGAKRGVGGLRGGIARR